MGFYSNLKNDEDMSFDDEDTQLEEQYQKIYKKIARDFVHLDDFRQVVVDLVDDNRRIFALLNALKRENAILKAVEYKNNLEKPRSERKNYKDVMEEPDE